MYQPIRAITHRRNQSIVTAGKQNRSQMGYKAGVKIIDGIPYTPEEQNAKISFDQIRRTIHVLCADQKLNPNLSEVDWAQSCFSENPKWTFPEANMLISWSVRNSSRI